MSWVWRKTCATPVVLVAQHLRCMSKCIDALEKQMTFRPLKLLLQKWSPLPCSYSSVIDHWVCSSHYISFVLLHLHSRTNILQYSKHLLDHGEPDRKSYCQSRKWNERIFLHSGTLCGSLGLPFLRAKRGALGFNWSTDTCVKLENLGRKGQKLEAERGGNRGAEGQMQTAERKGKLIASWQRWSCVKIQVIFKARTIFYASCS